MAFDASVYSTSPIAAIFASTAAAAAASSASPAVTHVILSIWTVPPAVRLIMWMYSASARSPGNAEKSIGMLWLFHPPPAGSVIVVTHSVNSVSFVLISTSHLTSKSFVVQA